MSSAKNQAKCISVVIPLYNHDRYIEDAIASVLAQESLLEIIVVDDGSTDESLRVAQRMAQTDGRIRVYSQQNRGAHAAINSGIDRAKGEWISILNSDDVYHQNRFSTVVKEIEKHNDADIFATGLTFLDDASQKIGNDWYVNACSFADSAVNQANALLNGNFVMTTSNFVVRRALFERIGGFAPLRYAHDLEFLLRALALNFKLVVLKPELLSYRLHPTNTIKENHENVRLEWAIVAAIYFLLSRRSDSVSQAAQKELFDILSRHSLLGAVLIAVAESSTTAVEAANDLIPRLMRSSARSAILGAV